MIIVLLLLTVSAAVRSLFYSTTTVYIVVNCDCFHTMHIIGCRYIISSPQMTSALFALHFALRIANY
jgi:hypothetical protein